MPQNLMSEHNVYTCVKCGKRITVDHLGRYAYKIKYKGSTLVMCSYSCLREMNKELFDNPSGKVSKYFYEKYKPKEKGI